ncbi:MAG: hypothetical protein K1X79_00565 [Oligoflexia bacterium]|nr:hypothetical protein [Oligoflexia bacterium]
MFWHLNEIALCVLAVFVFVCATEIGFRLGQRHPHAGADSLREHVRDIQSALLGLLALLLGFTFAMSMTRYESRRSLAVDEANAIGTTYLRAGFLPLELRGKFTEALRSYIDSRVELFAAGVDPVLLQNANEKAGHIQDQLWGIVTIAGTQAPNSSPIKILIESLNEVIDLSEKRQAALENHVPELVIVLLVGVAIVALGFLGVSSGLSGHRKTRSSLVLGALIALVLVVILDMDRPRRGLIQVSQESLGRLKMKIETPSTSELRF